MHRPAVFQDRHVRDIMAENSELKKFHEQMKRDVRSILMRHEGVQNRVVSEYTAGVNKRPGVGRARSSRTVESGVTVSLKKQWNSLKQLVESLETRVVQADDGHVIRVTDHEKELTKLRKELEELKEELEASRELIGQQQLLLQEQLLPPPGEAQPSPLWDAYFLEEQLRLQQDRATFEEQKRAFKDERDKFTEAAIRLGRERLQFKADQALFIKQQFLNMTPGLGTPPWKRTPPWSSFNADTPPGTHHNPKVNCTPRLHGPSNSHKKVAAKNPMTPSTAELYRVLRLAPPSNSSLVSQRREKRSRKEGLESEDNNRSNDSLSSRSESPEPEVLPHSALPLRMSMTPYLRPRPTPMSVPRGMKTPCTTELYRKLRLCSTDSGMQLLAVGKYNYNGCSGMMSCSLQQLESQVLT
ncbi:afadin- and alpha-actinin-binding protein-like [Rhinophrynus dorsalis]